MVREALREEHSRLPPADLAQLDEVGREYISIAVDETDDQRVVLLEARTKRDVEWGRVWQRQRQERTLRAPMLRSSFKTCLFKCFLSPSTVLNASFHTFNSCSSSSTLASRNVFLENVLSKRAGWTRTPEMRRRKVRDGAVASHLFVLLEVVS